MYQEDKELLKMDAREKILAASQLMERQDWEGALEVIYQGIQADRRNYELYFMLAQCKEMLGAVQQAALSYENALFYASDEDYGVMEECYGAFLASLPEMPKKVSFVLVTYNQLEMTQLCVESVRHNHPRGSYEIVVVDNLSTDGTRKWLEEQEDIRALLNDDNRGFPAACNQGAELAAEGNDIFLLNNDTIVMENSVYNLRMALYETDKVGAVGACSNEVGNRQRIEEKFDSIEEYARYAGRNNAYAPDRHERRLRLVGFAMIFRRPVWEMVQGFDERFGVGNYEDDDISMKLLEQGLDLVFCRDSFIFHFGSASFRALDRAKSEEYQSILRKNKQIFEEKWKIRWGYFSHVRHDLLGYIEEERGRAFSVLEIGCASGATLLEIGNRYPGAGLYGIELDRAVVDMASHYLDIVQGDIQEKRNPFGRRYDYIVLGDVLEHLRDPEDILRELKDWLNPGGCLVISVPNIMHISVLEPLLHGRFTYRDEGILDRTHLKFFTRTELVEMMGRCGYAIERMGGNTVELSRKEEGYLRKLCEMDAQIPEEELRIYQYRLKVRLS
ncbi:MAG: methyltransferase domain-containing protein [Lachnospiraceae bacterium]|nr:methyltransferase domain-containing protein [Lachnospiraceae bacterium]